MDAPPHLVAEILSPGTHQRDERVERELYARFGVHEYWIVDPVRRTVTVLTLAGDRFEAVPLKATARSNLVCFLPSFSPRKWFSPGPSTASEESFDMATTLKRLTVDDLDAIPEEHEGDRHELIDGELVVTPVPIIKHQIVSKRIFRYLDRHVENQNLGEVFAAPTGIRLDEHHLLIPDVWFVARDRLPSLGVKTMDAAPDLVIEILSPGTRRRDLNTKRELYARFRVPEYWIVDPEKEAITVFTLAGSDYDLVPAGPDGAVHSPVLPALRLTPDMVFTPIT